MQSPTCVPKEGDLRFWSVSQFPYGVSCVTDGVILSGACALPLRFALFSNRADA